MSERKMKAARRNRRKGIFRKYKRRGVPCLWVNDGAGQSRKIECSEIVIDREEPGA